MADDRSVSQALRAPGFRPLLASSVASAVGGSVSSVAVNWLVYHYTGSALDIAYVGLTGIVPGVALGLFAGVIADRYNRRRLMVTADLVRMTVMGVLAAALYFTGFSLFLVLGVMTLVYSFSAVFMPASQALLPRLVPAAGLESANGLLAALGSTGQTLGAGAGGLAIVYLGAVAGIGVNAATFGLSAVFLFQIALAAGRPKERALGPKPSFGQDLGEGLSYIRRHLPILEVTLGFLPGNFLFTMVSAFTVIYAATIYGGNAAVYGYLSATFAAGAAVGALVVPRIRARRFAGLLMGSAVVAQGGAIGILVVARILPVSLVATAAMGLSLGLINTVYFSTMQAIVPNEVLARVLSIDMVGSFVAIPAGLVVGGVLIASHGVLFVYAISAIGIVVNGLVLLALPGVRSMRYSAEPLPG
jgi:MFS family permease